MALWDISTNSISNMNDFSIKKEALLVTLSEEDDFGKDGIRFRVLPFHQFPFYLKPGF
jgi:hypothetical protein